jgi:hypothetical protein
MPCFKDTIWYHVAHPKVPCKVVGFHDSYGPLMEFESPVSFSGNTSRGPSIRWVCDASLLYTTSAEADANSWHPEATSNVSLYDHLLSDDEHP